MKKFLKVLLILLIVAGSHIMRVGGAMEALIEGLISACTREELTAWTRALEIDPDDAVAQGALEALGTLGAVNEAAASDPS